MTVKEDGSGPTEGAIAAQFKSGKPSWDLVDRGPVHRANRSARRE